MHLQACKHRIKLIVSDIDGTLLDSNHTFPQKTRDAIRRVSDIPFCIATGKTLFGSGGIIESLGFLHNSYGIFLNGAMVVQRTTTPGDGPIPFHRICHDRPMDPQQVAWFLGLCKQWDLTIIMYSYDSIYAPHSLEDTTSSHAALLHGLARFHEPPIISMTFESLQSQVLQGSIVVHKMIVLHDPDSIKTLESRIKAHPELPNHISILHTQPEMLEVMPCDTSKSAAIARVCEMLGISMDQVLAFGDGTNDVEMIRDVGMGVAMGNAVLAVRHVARFITLSNDECGVADTLNRIFFSE